MWGRISCPRCRRNVSKEQLYCPNCGTNLHTNYRPTMQSVTDRRMGQSYEERSGRGSLSTFERFSEIVIVIGLMIGLFFFFGWFLF